MKNSPLFPLLLLLTAGGMLLAHEVPNEVAVHAFVRPEAKRMEVLVRLPLQSMRDFEFERRGPGYLDLERSREMIRNAASLWVADAIEIRENGRSAGRPAVAAFRVSSPADRSFQTFAEAMAHVKTAPEPLDVYPEQALLDVLLEYPVHSDQSEFSIHAKVAPLGLSVVTNVRFLPPGGEVRAYQWHGDAGLVRLDPRWHQAALRFLESGFFHILEGIDHLLFLFCLVIPLRSLRSLIVVVTAFTVAHSITLLSAAFGWAPDALWFPPLIETLIAISIVYMALENIFGADTRRRWLITFGFGLIHGFGFSFALQETLQFAGAHLVTSLLAFNVGVELGQVAVLLFIAPVLTLLFRATGQERLSIIVLSALVAHTGWHWMLDRGTALLQFPFPVLPLWLPVALFAALGIWRYFSFASGRQSPRECPPGRAPGSGALPPSA